MKDLRTSQRQAVRLKLYAIQHELLVGPIASDSWVGDMLDLVNSALALMGDAE